MRLNLGCGGRRYDNYTNLDIRMGAGDVQWDCSLPLPYAENSIEEIRMDSFFEHLFLTEAVECLKDWYKKLQPGGELIITYLPDFDKVIEEYQNGNLGRIRGDATALDIAYGALFGAPCGSDVGQLHKAMYTRDSITKMIEQAGFKIVTVAYACDLFPGIENEFPLDKYSLWIKALK